MKTYTAQEMRESVEKFQAAMKQLRLDGFCSVDRIKVSCINGGYFAPFSPLKVKEGPQRVNVVDITDHIQPDAQFPAALFAWGPNRATLSPKGNLPDEAYVVVIFPDEGKTAILLEDGSTLQTGDGVIIVNISGGNAEQHRDLEQDLLDEYADSLG